jgi:hypothetical protein
MKGYHRFTVFTNDATVIQETSTLQGANVDRNRHFTWRLNFGKRIEGTNIKMGIESIHCRDDSILLENAQETLFGTAPSNASASQKSIALGNIDEKEVYTIRCSNVSSNYYYDSRDKNLYGSAPIIYLGKLNFQNTNPKESFCHFVNPDIMNNDFSLTIDENFQAKKGIKNTMHIGITFILYEDKDEY